MSHSIGSGYREVTIVNTDMSILDFAETCLTFLGINYNRHHYPSHDYKGSHYEEIRITRRTEFIKVYELIPLQSVKKAKLENLLNSYVTTLEYYLSRKWQDGR